MTFPAWPAGLGSLIMSVTVCSLYRNPNDCKAEFDSGELDMAYTDMVWAFICEWDPQFSELVFTME